jgi:ATP-binding cassette subfamily B protein
MVLASLAEVLSIGAVLPFLGVLMAPDRVFAHRLAQPFVSALGITEPNQLLLPLTVTFAAAVLLAGLMRLALLWASTRLSFRTGADLSSRIYHRTLYQPYAVHVSRHSSEVITGIASKTTAVIYATIQPALWLLSSVIMLLIILVALLAIDPLIALVAFGGFGVMYALIIRLTGKRLAIDGHRIARESTQVIKALQEGLGGIRDILIDGTQATYCEVYQRADLQLRRAQGDNQFVALSPRYGIEALGTLLIAALAYWLARQPGGVASAIPVLGALALGAQRLLPILQQAYSSWSQIRGGQASLQDTLALLDQPLPDHADRPSPKPLPFRNEITLRRLWLRYAPDAPWALSDVDLKLAKGSRVGFIGATGSGKSTLLDVVMGLLLPTRGTLEIDGQAITTDNHRAWQVHIAHVPQAIFLADATIEQNIAFGVPDEQIDHERVKWATRQAQIAETIDAWPEKYLTRVGERGVRLSGGQRQRIGIARALYKQADVIVFDEATSALDSETERAIIQAIERLSDDLTIFVVAHRLTTLRDCTQIVELADGRIKRIGSYEEIVNHAA